jgi:hypothetical protein
LIEQMSLSGLEPTEKRTFYDSSRLSWCERGVRQVSVIRSHFSLHIFGHLHSNGNSYPGRNATTIDKRMILSCVLKLRLSSKH